jgi:hypothetical protein
LCSFILLLFKKYDKKIWALEKYNLFLSTYSAGQLPLAIPGFFGSCHWLSPVFSAAATGCSQQLPPVIPDLLLALYLLCFSDLPGSKGLMGAASTFELPAAAAAGDYIEKHG